MKWWGVCECVENGKRFASVYMPGCKWYNKISTISANPPIILHWPKSKFLGWGPVAKPTIILFWRPKKTLSHWEAIFGLQIYLTGVCLLHLLSENIFPVLRSNWFYVLMKQKLIWNLSLCYFSLFCFYLSGYDARTAERKSDSTWRTWYKQTARVYNSRRPISWLFPEMQYPVIYITKFSNN